MGNHFLEMLKDKLKIDIFNNEMKLKNKLNVF